MNLEKDWDLITKRFIKEEGLKLKPYRCSQGKLTIGIGRCIDTNPFTEEEKRAIGDWEHGITKNAAMMLFRNDINRCERQLRDNISFYLKLDKNRQFALLNMCFQLGIDGLLGFHKMLACLENGNYGGAYAECITSKVYEQTPKRTIRNANAFRTGIWND